MCLWKTVFFHHDSLIHHRNAHFACLDHGKQPVLIDPQPGTGFFHADVPWRLQNQGVQRQRHFGPLCYN